jgi:hypothetical protein
MKAPVLPNVPDPVLNRAFDALRQAIVDATTGGVGDGLLLKSVPLLTAAPNKVPHGLGREWSGCFPVAQSTASSIYATHVGDTLPDRVVTVVVSADVTADLWVF